VQLNAGGSLANTLAGTAVLGRAANEQSPAHFAEARIGMSGCIGSDHLGKYFRQQLSNSGVEWVGTPTPGTSTGTVIVLTTPDAQRSFLSFPGASGLNMCPATAAGLASSRITVIEGYLWELPNAEQAISRAIALARAAGSIIVMTAADKTVVGRHRAAMLRAAQAADLIFANAEEARELMCGEDTESFGMRGDDAYAAEQDCMRMGEICPMAVVTDGSRGSCIAALGKLHVVPPHWAKQAPVDTCGAGDAYAAGFLFAYLHGHTVRQMGEFAAACASRVISRQGPNLLLEDAHALVSSLQASSRLSGSGAEAFL
jgi:sugar/nucleoside kinase (ribokinase family)